MEPDIDESQRAELEAFYNRPGFLTRRVHQISLATFMEVGAQFDLTPTQYGILLVLDAVPGIDQGGLVRLLDHDRSSIALAISNLKGRDLVEARIAPADKRRKILLLTAQGHSLFKEANSSLATVQNQIFVCFGTEEKEQFIRLMKKLVDAHEGSG